MMAIQAAALDDKCWACPHPLGYSGFGPYMSLPSSEHWLYFGYIPQSIWAWVAVAGGLIPAIACCLGLFWWLRSPPHLWEVDEKMRCWGAKADMAWLLY